MSLSGSKNEHGNSDSVMSGSTFRAGFTSDSSSGLTTSLGTYDDNGSGSTPLWVSPHGCNHGNMESHPSLLPSAWEPVASTLPLIENLPSKEVVSYSSPSTTDHASSFGNAEEQKISSSVSGNADDDDSGADENSEKREEDEDYHCSTIPKKGSMSEYQRQRILHAYEEARARGLPTEWTCTINKRNRLQWTGPWGRSVESVPRAMAISIASGLLPADTVIPAYSGKRKRSFPCAAAAATATATTTKRTKQGCTRKTTPVVPENGSSKTIVEGTRRPRGRPRKQLQQQHPVGDAHSAGEAYKHNTHEGAALHNCGNSPKRIKLTKSLSPWGCWSTDTSSSDAAGSMNNASTALCCSVFINVILLLLRFFEASAKVPVGPGDA